MAKQLKLRRGTTAQHSTFTGASGEVTVDTDKKTLVVHDGTTAGGTPVLSAAAGAVGTANIANNSVTAAKLASGAARANFGAGAVLQVVSVEYGTSMSTSSTTAVDTGLSASITPTSATSKILVLVSQSITPPTVGSNSYGVVQIVRNSSLIAADNRVNNNTQFLHTTWSYCILDSPATTSATTYKTRISTGNAGYAIEAQHANLRPSQITLMEIAA